MIDRDHDLDVEDADRPPPGGVPLPKTREKVAVLGAGPAGLAAAWSLSATRELRDRYEVTVYQVGWRAGGRCATGRVGEANRVEQNGTHFLFGSYYNAFRVISDCYAELRQREDERFGGFRDAFLPRSLLALKDFDEGKWHDWFISLPVNQSIPGRGAPIPNPTDYILMAIQFVVFVIFGSSLAETFQPAAPFGGRDVELRFWRRFMRVSDTVINRTLKQMFLVFWHVSDKLLSAKKLNADDPGLGYNALTLALIGLRRSFRILFKPVEHVHQSSSGAGFAPAQVAVLVDLGLTVMIGIIQDMVLRPGGFAAINRLELRDWLRLHGAGESTIDSAPLKAGYDSLAAYQGGAFERPNLAAGAALNGLMRLLLTYKGALCFAMPSEIGDSYVGPNCATLEHRGVRFAYFCRVWDVVPESDEDRVGWNDIKEVHIERQFVVRCKHAVDPCEGITDCATCPCEAYDDCDGRCAFEYDPYVVVKGRSVWPSQPNWDQLCRPFNEISPLDPDQPWTEPADIDSFYTRHRGPSSKQVILKKRTPNGEGDFDHVIFAIPIASAETSCPSILNDEENPQWRAMLKELVQVETQATRFWVRPTIKEVGIPRPAGLLAAYAYQFSVWEDRSSQIPHETWPEGIAPGMIASFLGPLETQERANDWVVPLSTRPDFSGEEESERQLLSEEEEDFFAEPARKHKKAYDATMTFLQNKIGAIWPLATSPRNREGIDWSILVNWPSPETGVSLDQQMVRANCGPLETYTIPTDGRVKHRLRTDESGYRNLYLAGDWTHNGMETSNLESAVMSGMQASRAICGYPRIVAFELGIWQRRYSINYDELTRRALFSDPGASGSR